MRFSAGRPRPDPPNGLLFQTDAYECFDTICNMTMTNNHKAKIRLLADEVKEFYKTKTPYRVYHGSTNSTRILSFKQNEMLDTSRLNKVIKIDKSKKTAWVEANVPMDKLVRETLKRGLVPPVIPEFPGITVGGAIQGGAGESSSFKWGFFSQTTNWVEYILGNGEVKRVSPSSSPDLYFVAAGSCGTMGTIASAEIQLVPSKKYVVISYLPVSSFTDCIKQTQKAIKSAQYDFIDCIMFDKIGGIMICGALSDRRVSKVRRFSRAHDQWFYLNAERIYKQGVEATESIPLVDYLFRYNRGAFWVGKFAFELFGIKFERFRRFVLNPILNTRKLYQALQVSGASQEYIVQDLTMPVENTVDFLNYIDKKLAIYPLWICPVKPEPKSPLLCNGISSKLAINIGVWGPRIPSYDTFVSVNRDIEKQLIKSKGKKWLYAHTYYPENEFWDIYDKQWYDKLRKKYSASTLPSIYDKVVVTKRYPVNARRGLFETIAGTAKLRIHK